MPPWKRAEIRWFAELGSRAMVGHPHGVELANEFLRRVAYRGPPAPVADGRCACRTGVQIRCLPAWGKRHSLEQLREHIQVVDDREFARLLRIHGLAVATVGWPNRRGDIVNIRTRASWWDIRTR